jgi:DNA-binding transcriptional ArsR family regulator
MSTQKVSTEATLPPKRKLEDHAIDHVGLMADVFSLLGDPGRLRLLLALNDGGELCVSELATRVVMDESAVSHALRLLRAYQVVGVRREGRHAYYRIVDDHVRLLIDATHKHVAEDHGTRQPTRHAG